MGLLRQNNFFGAWMLIPMIFQALCLNAQPEEEWKNAKRLIEEQKFDSALISLNKVLIEAEKIENDSIKCEVSLEIGTILCHSHRCTQGKNYFTKALNISKSKKLTDLEAKSLMCLGNFHLLANSYDSALSFYTEAILIFSEQGNRKRELQLKSNIAYLHLLTDDIEKAREEYEKIIEHYLISGDSTLIATEYFNLGLTYKHRKLYKDAIHNLDLAKNYSSEDLLIAKSFLQKAYIQTELKNYELAVQNFLTYDSLINDHVNRDYASELSELAEKFKTAEIERDNALKQAQIEENKRQLTLLYSFSALLILVIVLVYLSLTQRRKRLKQAADIQIQDLLQEQEIKTTYALLEGQDKERKRVAEELHDNLGSILVSLNMYVDALQERKADEVPELVKKISETATLANEETRKISHNLYSGMLKHFGLEAAINQLSEAVSVSQKIQFETEINLEKSLSTDTSLEIYRIIQELVNNSLKHADCSKIRVELNYMKQELNLIYEDNGVGFRKEEIKRGLGLNTIENRVKKLDGELTIDSRPDHGSTFIIEIRNV